eukprot:ctg_92.g67
MRKWNGQNIRSDRGSGLKRGWPQTLSGGACSGALRLRFRSLSPAPLPAECQFRVMAIHWMGRVQGAMQFRAAASVLAAASVVARGERVVQARLAAALSRLDLERTEAERISRELEQCRDLEHELGGKDAGGDEALLALARREAHALQQRLAALQRALERDTQLQARLVRELQERHGGGAAGDPDHGGGDDTQQVRSLFLEVLPGARHAPRVEVRSTGRLSGACIGRRGVCAITTRGGRYAGATRAGHRDAGPPAHLAGVCGGDARARR